MGKRARIPRSRERVAKLDPSLVFFSLPFGVQRLCLPCQSCLSASLTPVQDRRRAVVVVWECCVFLVKRDFV